VYCNRRYPRDWCLYITVDFLMAASQNGVSTQNTFNEILSHNYSMIKDERR
jgi:hypothetical protein